VSSRPQTTSVAEVDELAQVLPGQAHDPGQHPDRHLLGHGVHEVELGTAGPGQPARQHLLGEPLDEVLVHGHRALREAAGHDLAELGVIGRVGVDDRPAGGHVLVGRLLERDAAGGRERLGVPARGDDVLVATDRPETGVGRGFAVPADRGLTAQPGELGVGHAARPHVEIVQVDRRGHGD
jgi:hypothetical protein